MTFVCGKCTQYESALCRGPKMRENGSVAYPRTETVLAKYNGHGKSATSRFQTFQDI
jgi:hypothetical protein